MYPFRLSSVLKLCFGFAWGFSNISDLPFEKTGLLGVCVGFAWGLMTASAWGLGFAWGFDLFCLGMDFFERVAWGGDFQGLVCLGTSISAPLLLGDLLGVDLLGAVRQGCIKSFQVSRPDLK